MHGAGRRRFRFPRAARLTHRREFELVYAARTRRQAGPLTAWCRPNDLEACRLGLSVGRRVGGAVRRNRVKRMLRESFRLSRHELPAGYDFVVNVGAHAPLGLAEYQRLLREAIDKAHQACLKQQQQPREGHNEADGDRRRSPGS